MKPEKFVKKHARLVLGFLVGIMALSLAISFAPGTFGGDPVDEVVLKTNTGIEVTGDEMQRNLRWAYVLHQLSFNHLMEDEMAFRIRSRGLTSQDVARLVRMLDLSPGNPFLLLRALEQSNGLQEAELRALLASAKKPPEEHYTRIAESLALNRRAAEALGIRISEDDVEAWIQQEGQPWQGQGAEEGFKPDVFATHLRSFQMSEPQFREFLATMLACERYLSLMTDYARPTNDELAVSRSDSSLRLSYALFNPEESKARIIITPSDIQKYYKENAARFQSSRRIAFDYLIAEHEAFLTAAERPTDADLRAYFDANPAQFTLPAPAPREGQPPPDPPKKKFEDVRDEIRGILVRQRGQPKTQAAFRKLLERIGRDLSAAKDPAALALAGSKLNLTAMASEFREAGTPLTWGVTPTLGETLEDEKIVEGKIGRATNPHYAWDKFVFAEKQPVVGTICGFPVETDRGLVLVRMLQQTSGGPVPQDAAQDRRIERILEAKERAEAAQKSAKEFGKRIHTDGLAAALSWAGTQGFAPEAGETLYFPGGDMPRVESTLATPLARAAAGIDRRSSDPAADRWDVLPIKTGKGPRLLCVYLEDAVKLPPGEYLMELREQRDQQRWMSQAEARLRFQDGVLKTVERKNTGS